MPSPPRTAVTRYGIVCLLVVAGFTAVVAADAPREALAGAPSAPGDSCESDHYDPPEPGGDWVQSFEDGLTTDSLARWSGGRIVQVGAEGDCSLFVPGGETAALSNVTVDGTDGVVTGTLDLGSDGRLALGVAATDPSPTAGPSPTPGDPPPATVDRTLTSTTRTTDTPTATATDTSAPTVTDRSTDTAGFVIENDGPDFATTAVVTVGNRSETVTLPSGRFFDFAVHRTGDGGLRVAVWDPDESWDHEWDAHFESVPAAEWRVRLHGRAFLDGIAVGHSERDDATTPDGTDDAFPAGPDSQWDDGDPRPPADSGEPENSTVGPVVFGFVVVGLGGFGFRYAYAISRFNEQIDAIGSKTPASEVEPAGWNVALTKLFSVLVAAYGLYMILDALL